MNAFALGGKDLPVDFALCVDEGSGCGPEDQEGCDDDESGGHHDDCRSHATTLAAALHIVYIRSTLLLPYQHFLSPLSL